MTKKFNRRKKDLLDYIQHWLIALSAGAFVAALSQLGFVNSYSVVKMQAWGALLAVGFLFLFASLFIKAYQVISDYSEDAETLEKSKKSRKIEDDSRNNRR
ncbi:hypothetical protein [Haliea sp.]|jgi:hypothetical protein|uniref:hypothetical protein n=1 Tax=Haliea sp. TaxID=1932666 RepID=UPI000C47A2FB|nr:hypothetical protein [Haliea sp.]MAD65662.1 hypothetical protein [Haliea sp.]|tara:strand:+ start:8141 stop:8443 length:303 start_codon:yes stop_codon:yes gene_type:complete